MDINGIKKLLELDYAYRETDNDFARLSPTGLIKRLFEKTDKSGYLIVPEEPRRTYKGSEGKAWMRIKMNWTPEDRDNLILEFKRIYSAIRKMAELGPELGTTWEENKEILTERELEIWNIYIKDISDGLFERDIERSLGRLLMEDSLPTSARKRPKHRVDRFPIPSDEEIYQVWVNDEFTMKQINRRMDNRPHAFDTYTRAQRLYGLMVMEASEKLINREAKRLAKCLTLSHYMDSTTWRFENTPCYALPIYHAKNFDGIKGILTEWDKFDIYEESYKDEGYSRWSSLSRFQGKYGEDMLREYDFYQPLDSAVEELAMDLSRDREINPLRIPFGGVEAANFKQRDEMFFIIFPTEPIYLNEKTAKLSEDEVLDVLRAYAKKCGIDPKLVGFYEIPC